MKIVLKTEIPDPLAVLQIASGVESDKTYLERFAVTAGFEKKCILLLSMRLLFFLQLFFGVD